MLFTVTMRGKSIYLFVNFIIVLVFTVISSCSSDENDGLPERVKISIREVGNQLLLSNLDSTSLVLPVVALDESKYRLSFQEQLSIEPNNLVLIVKSNFQKSILSEYYRVEVIQCLDNEVAYSYEMSVEEESTIIPCAGRILPINCYIIQVQFLETGGSTNAFNYLPILAIVILSFWIIYRLRKKSEVKPKDALFSEIGTYKFYPEQNKLVKAAEEISLSKKECELLEIFYENLNDIVKREHLEKRVWEDNGVYVGRSLDTYISKLRKKLKDDASIKLTNVHGVGYKLEIIQK
jgi:hypothetical protein